MQKKRILRRVLWLFLLVFLLLNGIAFMHAYKFTHFSIQAYQKTKEIDLSTAKAAIAFHRCFNANFQSFHKFAGNG